MGKQQYWGLFSVVTGKLALDPRDLHVYVFASRQAARNCKKSLGKNSSMVEVGKVFLTDMAPSGDDEGWWG